MRKKHLPLDNQIPVKLFHFVYILPGIDYRDFLVILGDSGLSLHPLLSEIEKKKLMIRCFISLSILSYINIMTMEG